MCDLTVFSERLSRPAIALNDRAYYMVREQILRGAFPPGTVLSRRRLASQFGMSFLPISEALQRFESEGLVESRPRVGTRVRVLPNHACATAAAYEPRR